MNGSDRQVIRNKSIYSNADRQAQKYYEPKISINWASSTSTNTILGHSLHDLGQETGNKVIYALVCGYSIFYILCKLVLCNKHCELVLSVFHIVV